MKELIYRTDFDHSPEGAVETVRKFLAEEKLSIQENYVQEGNCVVEARTPAGNFLQLLGMDRRITVSFTMVSYDTLQVRLSGARWDDKAIAMAASAFLCGVTALSAIIGVVSQMSLIAGVKKTLDDYFGEERIAVRISVAGAEKYRKSDVHARELRENEPKIFI